MTTWLFLQAFGLALCLSTDHPAQKLWSGIGKMIASTAMIGIAWKLGVADGPFALPMFASLALSWIGDAALLGRHKTALAAGITAFLLAHLGYLFISLQFGLDLPSTVVMAVGVLLFSGAFLPKAKAGAGRLWPALVLYTAVVGAMAALSVGATMHAAPVVWGLGGVLFATSDIFVARRRFVKESPWNRRFGLPLYYVAQLLLSLGASLPPP